MLGPCHLLMPELQKIPGAVKVTQGLSVLTLAEDLSWSPAPMSSRSPPFVTPTPENPNAHRHIHMHNKNKDFQVKF